MTVVDDVSSKDRRAKIGESVIRVVIADDRVLVRDAVVNTLCQFPRFDAIGSARNTEALAVTIRASSPSVLVLGATVNGHEGIDLVPQLSRSAPGCRVILLANRPTRALVQHAIAQGALSVVPVHASLTHLVDAIYGVAAGCLTIDHRLLDSWIPVSKDLSERELEILRLTAIGAPVKEIATKLYLSPGTVRNLTSALIKKLGGRNRFEAAQVAKERGWL